MKSINSIREFICFNQKELIQYEYVVSQKHKNLRQYLENDNFNKDRLDEIIQDLITTSYTDLIKILDSNIPLINQLFNSVGISKNPRITIKTIEDGSVLDFFRSHAEVTLSTSEIENNTGFSEIMNSSKVMSFLRNNLEEDFIKGKYKNQRLNAKLRKKLIAKEVTWEECWSPIRNDTTKVSCYRSTLIIPMAIRVNETDNATFINKFSKIIAHAENTRTVWGFLCFDYDEKNIFLNNEDELKNIGYIIADILSLFLMFFYDHISGSETFNTAIEKL